MTLENALREEMQREVASLAQVEKDKEAKCELARRSDMQDQRQMYSTRTFVKSLFWITCLDPSLLFLCLALHSTSPSLPFLCLIDVFVESLLCLGSATAVLHIYRMYYCKCEVLCSYIDADIPISVDIYYTPMTICPTLLDSPYMLILTFHHSPTPLSFISEGDELSSPSCVYATQI